MSLADQITSDVADVFLVTDDFAEVVRRYAGGDVSKSSAVTAIVTWQPVQVSTDRGRAYTQEAELLISSDVTISETDAFAIGSRRCEVISVTESDDGVKTVMVKYNKPAEKGVRKADSL